jgi:hypothetical protein
MQCYDTRKWIAWVTETNPKWIPGKEKRVNLVPDAPEIAMAFAVIATNVTVALSLHL